MSNPLMVLPVCCGKMSGSKQTHEAVNEEKKGDLTGEKQSKQSHFQTHSYKRWGLFSK